MILNTTVEWSEADLRQLALLDNLRQGLFLANAAEDSDNWDSRQFALGTDDGIYGLINKAFMEALDLFGSIHTRHLVDRHGFKNARDFAIWIADRCIDNGESVTWNIERLLKDGVN